jgi:hypothetical protein
MDIAVVGVLLSNNTAEAQKMKKLRFEVAQQRCPCLVANWLLKYTFEFAWQD